MFNNVISDLGTDIKLRKTLNIYGSSRHGINKPRKLIVRKNYVLTTIGSGGIFNYGAASDSTITKISKTTFKRTLTYKQYELTNHLGNVLATILDRKTAINDAAHGDTLFYYDADVSTAGMYYAFGSSMTDLSYTHDRGKYRYGFNGEEKEADISGDGMSYDLGARFYDSRLGRMFSLDPLMAKYPYWSPYSYCGNNPIVIVDVNGMGTGEPSSTIKVDKENGANGVWGIARSVLGKDASNKEVLNLTQAIIKENNSVHDKNGNVKISGKTLTIPGYQFIEGSWRKAIKKENSNQAVTPAPASDLDVSGYTNRNISNFYWETCQLPMDVQTERTYQYGAVQEFAMNMRVHSSVYRSMTMSIENGINYGPWVVSITGAITNTTGANNKNTSYSGSITFFVNGKKGNTFPLDFTSAADCSTTNLINPNSFLIEKLVLDLSGINANDELTAEIKATVCFNTGSTGGVCAVDFILKPTPCHVEGTIIINKKQ